MVEKTLKFMVEGDYSLDGTIELASLSGRSPIHHSCGGHQVMLHWGQPEYNIDVTTRNEN
jgi:hypothetical protein